MPEVLVIANILHHKDGPYAEALRSAGFTIRFPKEGHRQLTERELAAALQDAVATIAGSEPSTRPAFADRTTPRAIARTGVGYDSIDVAAANKSTVPLCCTFGANHDAAAEQTFASLLAGARHIVRNHRMV